MNDGALSGAQLVQRPQWPLILESLLVRELLAVWQTGSGELLIDSAWISDMRLRGVVPIRFALLLPFGLADELTFSDYLLTFLHLGGGVRLMFREGDDPASQGSKALARELLNAAVAPHQDQTWRVGAPPLAIRVHRSGHAKRLLGRRAGYVGSANLTATGLYYDSDDTTIHWGEEALRPFVQAFMRDWDTASPFRGIDS